MCLSMCLYFQILLSLAKLIWLAFIVKLLICPKKVLTIFGRVTSTLQKKSPREKNFHLPLKYVKNEIDYRWSTFYIPPSFQTDIYAIKVWERFLKLNLKIYPLLFVCLYFRLAIAPWQDFYKA